MRRGREGFTLVELVVVVLIIAVLAQIAITQVDKMMLKARAAAVIGEFEAVKASVFRELDKRAPRRRSEPHGLHPGGARRLPS